jgi:hypothetical protein
VIGTGKTLFRNGDPFTEFTLVDSRTSSAGLVILSYARLDSAGRSQR